MSEETIGCDVPEKYHTYPRNTKIFK